MSKVLIFIRLNARRCNIFTCYNHSTAHNLGDRLIFRCLDFCVVSIFLVNSITMNSITPSITNILFIVRCGSTDLNNRQIVAEELLMTELDKNRLVFCPYKSVGCNKVGVRIEGLKKSLFAYWKLIQCNGCHLG